jgi:hypothetical protein
MRPRMALSLSIYIILQYSGPPADGGHPCGRRAGDRRAFRWALYYRWASMLTLWGKEDAAGAPTWRQGRRINTLRKLAPIISFYVLDVMRFSTHDTSE